MRAVKVDNPAIAIATTTQGRAADPGTSAWVSASAGSGKTKVLTDRVLNLLLTGTPPGKILCVTFTKAAAAEMANRIQERLGRWATANAEALEEDVQALMGARFELHHLNTARRLFADVLDAPQSLRIETLHAFCQSVLRRFPLEAGLSPHFDLMAEQDALSLLVEQEETVLTRGGSPHLSRALAFVTARQHERRFSELLSRIVSQRGAFQTMLSRYGGHDGVQSAFAERLGIPKDSSTDQILALACAPAEVPETDLKHAAGILSASDKVSDQDRGALIAGWLSEPAGRPDRFNAYMSAFLTQKGEPRKTLCTKAITDNHPDVAATLSAEQQRLLHVQDRIRAATVLQASTALAVIAEALLNGYAAAKARLGQLDYDDLISRTGGLLNRSDMAAWVLFKLDGGIDHVLVDETQDTNQRQWDILNAVTAEFFAGAGRERPADALDRTMFAVGDSKQSIYRFQGADPGAFYRMQGFHQRRIEDADASWRLESLAVSFRSAPAVLQAVDAVFGDGQPARVGVAGPGEDITHMAARKDAPGRVELWPLVPAQDAPVLDPWRPPVEDNAEPSARDKLAGLVAHQIATMVDEGDARAGDIMVLVRRRSGFVEELLRQLKRRNVAVAGADRLHLVEHIAVMDLMALGDVLLLPDDDLSLACVLKSPLIGLTEEELFELAHNRSGTLWQALAAHAGGSNSFGTTFSFLEKLAARVDFDSPYDLFAHVLACGGLKKFQSRLGIDVQDPLQAFLSEALRFEQDHPPSLQGFLQWLRAADVEIKRELDQSGNNAVRIMTVHGAKGLQAPVVILPDTTSVPQAPGGMYKDDDHDLLFWAPSVTDLDPVTRDLREALKAEEAAEQNRLLICGHDPRRRPTDSVRLGTAPQLTGRLLVRPRCSRPGRCGSAHRFDASGDCHRDQGGPHAGLGGPARPARPHQTCAVRPADGPAALSSVGAPWTLSPEPPRPLVPSETPDDTPGLPPFGESGPDPYARGRLIHRLLEHLPSVPQGSAR